MLINETIIISVTYTHKYICTDEIHESHRLLLTLKLLQMSENNYQRIYVLVVFVLMGISSFAQQLPVKGKIVSHNDNEPIIGATIIEKGTNNGTVSDLDGNFTLNLINSKAQIVVSYIGYVTQILNAAPNLQVSLLEDSQNLEEVVVTG